MERISVIAPVYNEKENYSYYTCSFGNDVNSCFCRKH